MENDVFRQDCINDPTGGRLGAITVSIRAAAMVRIVLLALQGVRATSGDFEASIRSAVALIIRVLPLIAECAKFIYPVFVELVRERVAVQSQIMLFHGFGALRYRKNA